jgi:hypothetical protein
LIPSAAPTNSPTTLKRKNKVKSTIWESFGV